MSSVATSNGQMEVQQVKKKVQIVTNSPDDGSGLQRAMEGITPGEFPSTAELMHKCLSVNPFEAKFAEANRMISAGVNGIGHHSTPSTNSSTTSGMSLLKIPSSLSQSPGIFSNISILTTDVDGVNENLKTADISKLLQQMKEQGSSSGEPGQAPRTADVLNAVLDMHSDRLHTINYINKPDLTSIFSSLSNPGSAPNSAGVLGMVPPVSSTICSMPSTSGGMLLAPSAVLGVSPNHSPRQPMSRDSNNDSKISPTPDPQQPPTNLLTALHQSDPLWDPRDVKPAIPPTSDKGRLGLNFYDRHDDMHNMPTVAIPGVSNSSSILSLDDMRNRGNRSCTSSDREITPTGSTAGTGRGRGRGRTPSDLQLDDRSTRLTILERNKAAAVRYRKRKKEEHDDMITRVHTLEQEKVQLSTRNQVLCRELDRVTSLLRERELRCVCMKGVLPLSTEVRSDSPDVSSWKVDVLTSPGGHGGMYVPQAQQLINGLGLPNGMSLKRTKM